ncbi:Vegetative incompatibility protein HET-E-1 [Colletotrichum tropicale]|nr:Vegetative incompatibility protein HET-E-1 [Colletotrichum tropicale]
MFVEHKVKKLALRKRYSPTTQEAVLKALLQKASDTFIWVSLVCAELDRVQERHTMAQLESIPEDLTRLYDQDAIYFIHQSAQDFLTHQGKDKLSSSSTRDLHHQLFVQSLGSLTQLKRNSYNLDSPGVLASDILRPASDPLESLEYSCVYWIDHLHEFGHARVLSDDNLIEAFVRKSFLHWLEALGILRKIPEAVRGIQTLVQIMGNTENRSLKKIVEDMRRFIRLHIDAIEIAPLQVYNSALVFSPSGSTIREMFKQEEPDWVKLKPKMADNWDPCIQTLEVDRKHRQVEDMQFSSDAL